MNNKNCRLSLLISISLLISLHSVTEAQVFNQPLNIPSTLSGTTYNLNFNTGTKQFFPGLTTNTCGINGNYLGPTLILQKDDTVSINVTNNLPDVTSAHWHGLHVPAQYDGGPHTTIDPGTTWNAHFRVMNKAGTYWYHPHVHMNTMPQVNSGLAGFIIVKDSEEALLNLPRSYGIDDFPILLQDKRYNASGQMTIASLGDSMQVNGTVYPYLDCPQQIVRLRLLNGSSARVYNIGFSDQRNFYVIGGDGGLLSQPYSTNRLLLSNGERVEILLNLSADIIGSSFLLRSFASEMDTSVPGAITGMYGGNGPLEAVDFDIMQFNVVSQTGSPVLSVPPSLVTPNPWNPVNASVTRNRTITGTGMVSGQGNFLMDGMTYDHMIINDTINLNDIEIWNITNTSNMAHPIHIHDVQFYILSRNGNAPSPAESGLKDVVLINPNETVSLITKFEDFANDTVPYMYHCHNLAHEDMGMMLQFIVTDGTSGIHSVKHQKEYIYPNPASHYWQIFTNEYPQKVLLYDISGKEIQSDVKISFDEINVDCRNLSNGIYIVRIEYKGKRSIHKLVKN